MAENHLLQAREGDIRRSRPGRCGHGPQTPRLSVRAVPVALAFWALALSAQPRPESDAPLVLPRVRGPVTLDGLSDEPAWRGVPLLPCVGYLPNSGAAPSERTEVLVAYDDGFLYVAGRLYDREPDKIQATSRKRDDMKLSNDWFGVILDTFGDHENALCFYTTPAGLRLDMTVFNDAQGDFPVDKNWNTFWDVATVRNAEGWFAEIRIPLSSLRFQATDGRVVMGLIANRYIARKNEAITFPFIPPKWGFWGSFKPSRPPSTRQS